MDIESMNFLHWRQAWSDFRKGIFYYEGTLKKHFKGWTKLIIIIKKFTNGNFKMPFEVEQIKYDTETKVNVNVYVDSTKSPNQAHNMDTNLNLYNSKVSELYSDASLNYHLRRCVVKPEQNRGNTTKPLRGI